MKFLAPIFFLFLFSANTVIAQDQATPKMKIGSTVLVQEGTDEYAYNNGPYHYEKTFDANGAQDELYDRAKRWVTSNLKAGDQNQFDDVEKKEIHTTVLLVVPGYADVNFKLNLYFKANKYRIVANNFFFVTDPTQGTMRGPFNDLRPAGKKWMIRAYEAFDKQFLSLLSSLNSACDKSESNW